MPLRGDVCLTRAGVLEESGHNYKFPNEARNGESDDGETIREIDRYALEIRGWLYYCLSIICK